MIGLHDSTSRRSFLRAGALGLGGLTLPGVLHHRARAAAAGRSAPDTAVILIFLSGGPAQLDTFDPKPDAPEDYRGPFRSIPTTLPGVRFTELFPQLAKQTDRLSVLRALHHTTGGHHHGYHWMLTGYHPDNIQFGVNQRPAVGAVAARFHGPNRPGLPPYVSIPRAAGYGSPAYLGVGYGPFEASDPNTPDYHVPGLKLSPGLTADKLADRTGLRRSLDTMRRDLDTKGVAAGMDQFDRAAVDLVLGADARRAFDLGGEDQRLRDRYGRTRLGQSCLLARRLVESGVTFVMVEDFEFVEWDNHGDQPKDTILAGTSLKGRHLDRALAALLDDLAERGQLDRTLVVAVGEFGRSPRVKPNGGRDHWPMVFPALLAGGGLKHGQAIGSSSARAEVPKDRPLGPQDLLATVYHVLGIDPGESPPDAGGRPLPLLSEGAAIRELI